MSEAAIGGVLQEKVLLEIWQNSMQNTCARVSFSIRPATLLKKRLRFQVSSSELCQISNNTFFTEHLLATASAVCKNINLRPIS